MTSPSEEEESDDYEPSDHGLDDSNDDEEVFKRPLYTPKTPGARAICKVLSSEIHVRLEIHV